MRAMITENKQCFKTVLKKIGEAIWWAFPWICWVIVLFCWFLLLLIHADECSKQAEQLAIIETENAVYESENIRLYEEVDWLRSLIEKMGIGDNGDGQIQ